MAPRRAQGRGRLPSWLRPSSLNLRDLRDISIIRNYGIFRLFGEDQDEVLDTIRRARTAKQGIDRVTTLRNPGTKVETPGRDLNAISESLRLGRQYIDLSLTEDQQSQILSATGFTNFNDYINHLKQAENTAQKDPGLRTQRISYLKIHEPNENNLDVLNTYLTEVKSFEDILQELPNKSEQQNDSEETETERDVTNKEDLEKLRRSIETKILNTLKSSIQSALEHTEKKEYEYALGDIEEINKIGDHGSCYSDNLSGTIKNEIKSFKKDLEGKVKSNIEEIKVDELNDKSLTQQIEELQKYKSLKQIIDVSQVKPDNEPKLEDEIKSLGNKIEENKNDSDKVKNRVDAIEKLITSKYFKDSINLYNELKEYNDNTSDQELKSKITLCLKNVINHIEGLIKLNLNKIEPDANSNEEIQNLTKINTKLRLLEEHAKLDFINQDLKNQINYTISVLRNRIINLARTNLTPEEEPTRDLNDFDTEELMKQFEEMIRDDGFMTRFQEMIRDFKKIGKFIKGLSFLKVMLPEDMLQGNSLFKKLIPSLQHLGPALKEVPELVKTIRLLTSGEGSFNLLEPEEKKSYATALVDYFNIVTDPSRAGETSNNINAKIRSVEKIISILEGFQKEQSKNNIGVNHWISDELSKFKKIKERYDRQLIQLDKVDKIKSEKKDHETKVRETRQSANRALDDYRTDKVKDSLKDIYKSRAEEFIKEAEIQIEHIKNIFKTYTNIERMLNDDRLPVDERKRQAELLFTKHLADKSFNKLKEEWHELLTEIEVFKVRIEDPNDRLTEDKKAEIRGRLDRELRELFKLQEPRENTTNTPPTPPQTPTPPAAPPSTTPDTSAATSQITETKESESEKLAKIPDHLKNDVAAFLRIGVSEIDSKTGIVGELRNKLSEILTNEKNQQNIKKGVLNKETAMAIYLFSELNKVDTVKPSLNELSSKLDNAGINQVIGRVAEILRTDTTQSKDLTGAATRLLADVDTPQTSSSSIDKRKFVELNKTFLRKILTEAISERDTSNEISERDTSNEISERDTSNGIIEDIIKQIDFDSFTILEIYNESNEFISRIKQLVLDEIIPKHKEASESDTNSSQIDTQDITRKINEILKNVEKID